MFAYVSLCTAHIGAYSLQYMFFQLSGYKFTYKLKEVWSHAKSIWVNFSLSREKTQVKDFFPHAFPPPPLQTLVVHNLSSQCGSMDSTGLICSRHSPCLFTPTVTVRSFLPGFSASLRTQWLHMCMYPTTTPQQPPHPTPQDTHTHTPLPHGLCCSRVMTIYLGYKQCRCPLATSGLLGKL